MWVQENGYVPEKVDNINIDMSFLKELAQPSMEAASLQNTRLNNIESLAQLLKVKNSKYSFSEQTREIGQDWIRKKGGDLNPLIERVKQVKEQVKTKQQQKKAESECYFYIPKLTQENQQEYIQKNFQFGTLCMVQSIMSQDKNKGSLTKRVMQRRRANRDNNQTSPLDALPTINLQIRNPIKNQQYLKSTKQTLDTYSSSDTFDWSQIYKRATKQQFWQILSKQVTFLDTTSRNSAVASMAMASLKMVESEFNLLMPSNYDNILYYLTNNYLGKMRGQYESDGGFGPVWGISYMLYRAGRKEQFYKFLPDEGLKILFEQADASIAERKPKKLIGVQQNGDVFHDQLIYALKGQGKCSTQALCNPQTLDIVWVFLRNSGIFQEDMQNFTKLRKKLYDSYRGPLISEAKLRNLLYLLGYYQIVQIGVNDLMDQDDFLHYLIALYHSPLSFTLPKSKKQLLENKLTEELSHYIQQLLLDHDDSYLNYMVLIPHSKLAEEVSSIVASSQLLQVLDWKYLSRKLSPVLFQSLVHVTLQKYVSLHQDYMQVAKKQVDLLNDNNKALTFILRMFIREMLSNKISLENLRQGDQFAKEIFRYDQKLKKQFGSVFSFFEESMTLVELLQRRNQSELFSFIGRSKYLLLIEQLTPETRSMLQKLIQFSGFECYIHFIRNTIKAYEITMTRKNRLIQLQELHSSTLTAFISLIRAQPYSQFTQLESVQELIRILEEAISKNNLDI